MFPKSARPVTHLRNLPILSVARPLPDRPVVTIGEGLLTRCQRPPKCGILPCENSKRKQSGSHQRRVESRHRARALLLRVAPTIHSSQRTAEQVISFKQEWADRGPVRIVPTKYYATPTEVFREHRFSLVIWANHLMRTCITAMQRTAQQIYEEESLLAVEDRIAPIAEVFRLQRATELAEAEKRYLPQSSESTGIVFPTIPSPPSMESTRD